MSSQRPFSRLSPEEMVLIDRLCDRLEGQWRRGNQVTVEEILGGISESLRSQAIQELLPLEITCRLSASIPVTLSELLLRFPALPPSILAESLEQARQEQRRVSLTEQRSENLPRSWGPYRLEIVLGAGGMGTVYRATKNTGEIVAVKLLRREVAAQSEFRKRFLRELQTAIRLQHPHLVQAFEAGDYDDEPGLVMEYVAGMNLEEQVARHGPLPVEEARRVLEQVVSGLQYAHSQGVIHRDLKPANLLRDASGQVKILDLGLARQVIPAEHMSLLTRTGMLMGTAAFMSPEQARDPRHAEPRSDWYSLGCTLFYLLTGRAPYQGANPLQLALAHSQEPVPAVRDWRTDIPQELEQLVGQLLAKEPTHRPANSAEILRILNGESSPSTARPEPDHLPAPVVSAQPLPVRRKQRGSSTAWTWGTVSGLLLAALFTVILWNTSGRSHPPPVALPEPPVVPLTVPDVPSIDPQTEIEVWSFNGYSSYVHVPQVNPQAGATYTIEVLARPNALQTSNVVCWLGPDWMAIFLTADGHWGVARRFGETQQIRTSSEFAQLREWVYLTAVFDQGEMHLDVNGVRQAGALADYPLPETTGGLYLGGADSRQVPNRFFRGEIHSIRIMQGTGLISSGPLPDLNASHASMLWQASASTTPERTPLRLHDVQLVREPWTPLLQPPR